MSVLVFIDDSRWDRPAKKDFFATTAGVAIEEIKLADFTRKLSRLKNRFFKRAGVGDYPIRGRLLLNNRALDSFRKQEFVSELFSLCRLMNITVFGTTRKYSVSVEQPELSAYSAGRKRGAISDSERTTESEVSLLLAYLFERINSFALENHPGTQAKLVFKSLGQNHDARLCSGVMNFIYQTSFGGGFEGLLGQPLFAPREWTAGLQIADLFAYIINQHFGGRPEMRDYFAEVESMQFVSSIERDEFQLRGINLIE